MSNDRDLKTNAAEDVSAPQRPPQPAVHTCLSCGARVSGAFCSECGQKNDDMRRSFFRLAREYIEVSFAFDGRMWRTIGLLAARPGLVPHQFANGRRQRYTPPVRLFIVVSFLFFLMFSVSGTYIVAIDLREAEGVEAVAATAGEGEALCELDVGMRSFVRAASLSNDKARWQACQKRWRENFRDEMKASLEGETVSAEVDIDIEGAGALFERALTGLTSAIEDPRSFNAAVNDWLPRVLLVMAPVMALLLGLFIRGRDALFFDHLVLALYSHAVGFVIVGLAVLLGQAGVQFAGPLAGVALFAYFLIALRRAYKRGWLKTVFTAVSIAVIYQGLLALAVLTILSRIIFQI